VRSLRDKIVVLTGASSGIGRATALALGREGAVLHLVARRERRLEEVCAEIRRGGGRATAHVFDVRQPGVFAALAEQIDAEHGRIDVLINNAGVGVTKTFLETTDDDWQWTLDTNLHSVVSSIRAFLPSMLERGEGIIVNVSSIAGVTGSMLSAYTASKSAVVGLSEALLLEYGDRGIQVVVVCPGMINTEIAEAAIDAGRTNDTVGPKLRDVMKRFGAAPEAVARDIVAAIHQPRFMVLTPAHASAMLAVYRLLPGISRKLTRFMGS
jgi:NAD(P)-dependent dehydrogenase (short-subunit alcohol dehydrogenase family)